jgi:hypothetical protein
MVVTHRLYGYWTDFELPIQPPVELFGKDSSSKFWPLVKATVPKAYDFFMPPGGKIALVLTGTNQFAGSALNAHWQNQNLIVFEIKAGTIGRELFHTAMEDGSDVVMVEWAIGQSAHRWDAMLRGWARKGLPEASFVMESKTAVKSQTTHSPASIRDRGSR